MRPRLVEMVLQTSRIVLADGGLEAVIVGTTAGLHNENIRVIGPASTTGHGPGPRYGLVEVDPLTQRSVL